MTSLLEKIAELEAEIARLEAREREAREMLLKYRLENCWCRDGEQCLSCRARAWLEKGGE